MTGNFESGTTRFLLNDNAQCNPIWVCQAGGLYLAYFPTPQRDLTEKEQRPANAGYERCERRCLPCERSHVWRIQ